MTAFRVLIDVDNDIFDGDPRPELRKILTRLTDRHLRSASLSDLEDGISLLDTNGNTVGRAQIVGLA